MSQAGGIAAEHSGGHRPLFSWAAYWFSMLASLMVHGVLFVLLLVFFVGGGGSGGTGAAGKGGGDFIEVGFSSPRGGGSQSNSPARLSDLEGEFAAAPSLPTIKSFPTNDEEKRPPVTVSRNAPQVAAVDRESREAMAGAPTFSNVPRSVAKMRASRGSGGGVGDGRGSGGGDGDGTGGGAGAGRGTGTGSGGGSGDGPGTTQFFKIRDRGLKFVYVLDRSVSMSSYNAIRVAKAQLMRSINSLNAEQQFQIVFYNEKPTILRLGDENGKSLFRATDINRTVAGQFISSIQPESSTAHLPALEAALAFQPDVIFLLTDAGEPHLMTSELQKIRRMNGGRARIHCIEFHQGRRLTKEVNFLERLAMENGGQYEFRDITEFNAESVR